MNTSLYNKVYLINYSEADNTTISLKRNETYIKYGSCNLVKFNFCIS